jgi:signal transduction histidine kinase/CheY-like chemotaxis protein
MKIFRSVRVKISIILIAGFAVTTTSVLLVTNFQLKEIVDHSQELIYQEKVDYILRDLEQTYKRLRLTRQVEAYEEAFKESILKKLRYKYYTDDMREYPFIIDTNGTIIMHPVFAKGDKSLSGHPYLQKILSVKDGNFNYTYETGEKKWYVIKSFENWDWVVGYALPHDMKYAAVRTLRNRLAVLMAVISMLVLVVLFIVTAQLLHPITKLTEASKTMAEGNLDHEVEIKSRDELGILADSFITMRDSIKKQILELNIEINLRKQVEQELMAAKDNAEESDRLKSIFLANLSHEIRTPMNGILGFADLLKNKDLSEVEQNKYIEVIENSGQRMLRLIADLVDISTIETGHVEIKTEPTNLNGLIDKVYDFFKPKAEKMGLQFTCNKELANQDSNILTDSTKLEQVLTNLVHNAIKFTYDGKISFGYKLKDNFLHFWVEDTGKGIHSELKELIFDRFRQVEDTALRGEEGSGLGLAICKAYVELMNGKIWVESKPDKGSLFCVTLPYYKTTPQKSSREKEEVTINYQEDSILVVEDDAISRFFLLEVLKESKFKIIRADNGQDAIDAVKADSDIKLVLMDMKMPVMNGIEATKEIRKTYPDLPIIAQTAYASNIERQEAINAGCNDVIVKPINKRTLYEKINTYLK